MTAARRARGEPLMALGAIMALWIGVRVWAWEPLRWPSPPAPMAALDLSALPQAAAEYDMGRSSAATIITRQRPAATRLVVATAGQADHVLPGLPVRLPPRPAEAGQDTPATAGPAIPAGGANVGAPRLAGSALLPFPAQVASATAQRNAGTAPHWSGDAWVFLRGGGTGAGFAPISRAGVYGASQAGAVLRYRFSADDPHRLAAYVRASAALGTREQEVAAGLSARPLAGVPLLGVAEARIASSGGERRARPAIGIVTELAPQALPLDFTGEAYLQAGYVAGRGATGFADGLIRAERPLLATPAGGTLRVGGGVWAARQRGAERVDAGPVVSLRLPLASAVPVRIEADWRFRLAGTARPGSGPALTVSTGF